MRATFIDEDEEYLVISFDLLPDIPEILSEAEREVVQLIIQGATNEEIARIRYTSARTVANQVHAAFSKLGVGCRVELVRTLILADAP